jgi:hypothetical protein
MKKNPELYIFSDHLIVVRRGSIDPIPKSPKKKTRSFLAIKAFQFLINV